MFKYCKKSAEFALAVLWYWSTGMSVLIILENKINKVNVRFFVSHTFNKLLIQCQTNY